MQQNYNILKVTIPVTENNREKVLSLPAVLYRYRVGDEIDYEYRIDSDINLGLANCSKKEFQSILWAVTTYPALVNEIETEQAELCIKQTQKQMRKAIKRLKKLLKAISTTRNSQL